MMTPNDNITQEDTEDTQAIPRLKFKSLTTIALGLIIIFSLAAYINSLQGNFIWDDWYLIVNNKQIRYWDCLGQNITMEFLQRSYGIPNAVKTGYYRPLIKLSYMLDYSFWGNNPFGYHITNLLWHIANGIIIYFFTLLLFQKNKLALITSLLFVTHPVHSESVSWIAGRTDVICGFFFFTSLYLYSLGHLKPRHKKRLILILSLISFLLALCSKEMAATLPLILIFIDYFFISKHITPRGWIERAKRWLPYWMVLFLFVFIRIVIVGILPDTNFRLASISKYHLLLTFGRAIIYYLKNLFYPTNLNPYIIIELITEGLPLDVMLIIILFFGSLGFVCLERKSKLSSNNLVKTSNCKLSLPIMTKLKIHFHEVTAYLKKKNFSEISFAVLFFWISLVPVSNLAHLNAPLDMKFPMAIRFLYIPSFAFCIGLASLLTQIKRPVFKHVSLGTIICALMMVFYTGEVIHANMTVYKNGVGLFKKALEESPLSVDINVNLGDEYARERNYGKAIPYYLKALRIKPDNARVHMQLGYCYYFIGSYQTAIVATKRALTYDDKMFDAHFNIGLIYWKLGKIDMARSKFQEAFKINPNYYSALDALKRLELANYSKTSPQKI